MKEAQMKAEVELMLSFEVQDLVDLDLLLKPYAKCVDADVKLRLALKLATVGLGILKQAARKGSLDDAIAMTAGRGQQPN